MITPNKKRALLTFCHRRLSGKYSDYSREENKLEITDGEETIGATTKIFRGLEKEKYTVADINAMPSCFVTSQLTYYYESILSKYNKLVKKDEEIIEAVIALSIMAYLEDEKEITLDFFNLAYTDLTSLISRYELILGEDRTLVTKMIKVGTEIVEAVEKANFSNHIKRM